MIFFASVLGRSCWSEIQNCSYSKAFRRLRCLWQLCHLFFQHSACLTEDSGISEGGSENNEKEEALFTRLKALAQDLESKLTPQSNIVQEITQVRRVLNMNALASWYRFTYIWGGNWRACYICMTLFLFSQSLKSSASELEETGRLSRLASIMEPEKR